MRHDLLWWAMRTRQMESEILSQPVSIKMSYLFHDLDKGNYFIYFNGRKLVIISV